MTSRARSEITGLLLAGGQGRRMGGADKGLQLLNGRLLAAWVLERLAPQAGPLLISANRNADRYAALGARVLSDLVDGFAGPLAGIQAGLAACETPLLASVPCDTPFLPADLVERLHEGMIRSAARAAVARADGRLQPVFALMRRELLDDLTAFLDGGGRSMNAWLAALPAVVVDFADAKAFANANTPEQLAGLASGG